MRRNLIAALVIGGLLLAGGISLYKADTGDAGRTTKAVSAKTVSD
jgi:outer membrane murein-binding lipoprotein Lpp